PGGNVGRALITALTTSATTFHITALIRPTSTYRPPYLAISTLTTDFTSSPSLISALRDQDALVCCVPASATSFDNQKLLIDAAIEAGVKLFFASEFVGDVLSAHYEIFPKEWVGEKVRVRRYLEEKAREGQICWTALNGGPFFDMWLLRGPAGFDIPARKAKIYGSGTNLSCQTPLPVLALAIVKMLTSPHAILNRAIYISGVKGVTQNNLLQALEEETGAFFTVKRVDVGRIKEEAMAALERGDWKAASRGLTINAQFNERQGSADFWDLVDNEVVGVEAVGVREAVREALSKCEGEGRGGWS
ncbi:MAG: hypothetical protein M1835_002313, partial [Candelina submexicana]